MIISSRRTLILSVSRPDRRLFHSKQTFLFDTSPVTVGLTKDPTKLRGAFDFRRFGPFQIECLIFQINFNQYAAVLLHHFLFHQNQVLDTLNNGPLIGAGFKIQTVLWQGIELKMSNPALDYQVTLYLNFARVGGFHMQGTYGRSHSELLRALNNAADGSLRLALRVKSDEIK